MILMMSGYGTVESAVDCMRQGAFDYMLKPFSLNQIEVLVKKAESYGQVIKLNRFLNEQLTDSSDLIGDSESMLNLKRMLRKVAPTDATVLIQGENGTGKELIAREIYHASNRSQGPYIKVNCAAISETLIETEFFGHEKGAFTGATDRREGRFELANGGTLLLDEISEITPRLQAKLLRVLQEQEFERVGGTKTIKVDVRVLATTNRDLKKAVANGDFREDLYYRLHVFPVHVPPLRERVNDIARLANHFLQRFARRHGLEIPGYSQAAMERLLQHSWPGNVRELQNMVERAVIMTETGTPVQSSALGLPVVGAAPAPSTPLEHLASADVASASSPSATGASTTLRPLDEVEKDHILRVLEAMKGNRTQAANVLQISIRTLRNKLNEYKIDTGGDGAVAADES